MRERIMIGVGVAVGVGLMIAALWLWHQADEMSMSWSRRVVGLWAVRSLSLALGSAAQVVLMTLVVSRLFRWDAFGESLRLSAALACTVSLVSAVALGLSGR